MDSPATTLHRATIPSGKYTSRVLRFIAANGASTTGRVEVASWATGARPPSLPLPLPRPLPLFAAAHPCRARSPRVGPIHAKTKDASSPTSSASSTYETVIGIETHVQLQTRTKAFCHCANEYGAPVNSHVCPVCLGHPGTLPTLNVQAVDLGIAMGLALNCDIAPVSSFDRKQYFYADLPKGYQISQYATPICGPGHLELNVEGQTKKITIERAHLEEDAGKMVHAGADALSGSTGSAADYNRAGVPLLEIVTGPDFRSGKEAAEYGAELRRLVRTLGVGNGNMQEGSMRCDVNISVRASPDAPLGTKVEVKNMNSFTAMQKAIEYETQRQTTLLREGRGAEIVQETRTWDENGACTVSMRKKEGLADYRYFPEPDLPPLVVTKADVDRVKAVMPELPSQKRARYAGLGVPPDAVLYLAEDLDAASYFDATLAALPNVTPKEVVKWVVGDLAAYCKNEKCNFADLQVTPAVLAEFVQLVEESVISGKIGKEILPELLASAVPEGVRSYVQSKGLVQESDPEAIKEVIRQAMAANPDQLAAFRDGKTKLKGHFQGQCMKISGGTVNPKLLAQLLEPMLTGEME